MPKRAGRTVHDSVPGCSLCSGADRGPRCLDQKPAERRQPALVMYSVELATNRRVDVVEEGVDIALRVRFPPLEDTGLLMKRLAMNPQVIVGSPALINRIGLAKLPGSLADYPSLALTSTAPRRTWDLSKDGKDRISIAFSPRMGRMKWQRLRWPPKKGAVSSSCSFIWCKTNSAPAAWYR